jgi:hypothetical protein
MAKKEENSRGLTWLEGGKNPFFRLQGKDGRIVSVKHETGQPDFIKGLCLPEWRKVNDRNQIGQMI